MHFVYFLLGISPASNCSWPTFRNPVSVPSSKAGCTVWNWYRVPKLRPATMWRRGNTQKKIYNIQITAKVWNQEQYMHLFRFYNTSDVRNLHPTFNFNVFFRICVLTRAWRWPSPVETCRPCEFNSKNKARCVWLSYFLKPNWNRRPVCHSYDSKCCHYWMIMVHYNSDGQTFLGAGKKKFGGP